MKNLLLLTLICIVTAGSIIGAQSQTCQDIQNQINLLQAQYDAILSKYKATPSAGGLSQVELDLERAQMDALDPQIRSLQGQYDQNGCHKD